MDEDDHDAGTVVVRRRGWRRLRRWLAMLLVLLAVALAVAWWQRRGIAEDFVARELAKRGVAARYKVAEVGLSTQRLTDVVIGNPRNPDLTADWIEVYTHLGWGGPEVTGIALGHGFLKARLTDGRVSLGAIDRLMPPPSGKPFALPRLDARADDLRVRLATEYGAVGIKIAAHGRLNDGFAGRVALVAPRLEAGGCTLAGLRAPLALEVQDAAPSVAGPVRLAELRCGEAHVATLSADVQASFGAALDRWRGSVRLAAEVAEMPSLRGVDLSGRIDFAGTAVATAGAARVEAATLATRWGDGRAAIDGQYRVAPKSIRYTGTVQARDASLSAQLRRSIAAVSGTGQGTPVGPIVDRLAGAAGALARRFDGDAHVEAQLAGNGTTVRVGEAVLRGGDGARVRVAGPPLDFGALSIGGTIATTGGGLPEARVALRQAGGGAIAGRATVQPYQALGSRAALTPLEFTAGADGLTRVTTTLTLTGPLGDGRVEALRMPIDARWQRGTLALDPGCTPLAWQRVAAAGLVLDPGRLVLCPTGRALVTLDDGRIAGGARIAAPRLTGRIGGTPLTLAARGAEVALGSRGFTLSGVAARLGSAQRLTRIDAARLTGHVTPGGVEGRFEGAGGQIGNVPLILSNSAGSWRFAGGKLTLDGGLQVADAAESARFKPLTSDDVALTLAGSRIEAAGTLRTPRTGAKVADVTLHHDLAAGRGAAVLAVPGITFAERGLQPDDLTPLTFGVIAAVSGTVVGRGDIAWDAAGVTSTGSFRTDDLDLAAAFGPVSGIRGEVRFSDLLGLVTPPGQVATITSVNPGVPVENGTIRYQLLAGQKVQVESGRWPFAGGELVLEPTLLDFGTKAERRMTFRVAGIDAAQFLQQFQFENLNATGTFDGVLPMVFDEKGGRIENGHLEARGGGGIAYVGEVTQKDVGFWGNLAFQALRALDYKRLEITMNGPLAGEMVTELNFAGVSQGKGTTSNFLIRRLARLPFVFNVTIRAPFRQLIDSVRSYYEPSRLIERNLPSLIEDYNRQHPDAPIPVPAPLPGQATPPPVPIQPSESEKSP